MISAIYVPDCSYPVDNLPNDTVGLILRATSCPADDAQTTEEYVPYPWPFLDYDDEPAMCGEDATAGAPVRLTNGNMRYEEALPLPSVIGGDRLLTYDTKNDRRGFFGTGWWSIFDATVDDWGSAGYRVITESNHSILFDSSGNQVFPATGPLGSFDDLGEELGYKYTNPDGSVVRHFNSDRRLTEIELPAQNSSLEIEWNDDLHVSIFDTSGRWTRNITLAEPEPGSGMFLVSEISSADATLEFSYENLSSSNHFDQFQIAEISADTNLWREYNYDHRGRLLEAKDGTGAFIETHSYDPEETGLAISSRTANENITDIQYHLASSTIDGRAPKPELNEYLVRVESAASGELPPRVTEYYIRPVLNTVGPEPFEVAPHRVYEVNGDCGCSDGGDYLVFARDDFGRVIRRQDARGYVTKYVYNDSLFPGVNQPQFVERGFFPEGCDPIGAPPGCRLDPDQLGNPNLILSASDEATEIEYGYGDGTEINRNRITSIWQPSVVPGSQEGALTTYAFNSETGAAIGQTRTGSIWDHANGAVDPNQELRQTSTALYGVDDPPIFYPTEEVPYAIRFNALWNDDAQPTFLPKQIDGPLPNNPPIEDITEYVYYPVTVDIGDRPDPRLRGRLAATKVPANDDVNPNAHLVTVYNDYDVFGNPTEVIDPRGVVTKLVYDSLGRLESSTLEGNCDPDFGFNDDPLCDQDLTTSYAYYGTTNRVKLITQPGGANTKHIYTRDWGRLKDTLRGPSAGDLPERIRRFVDPDTGAVTMERTQRHNGIKWVTYKETVYEYDAAGRLKTLETPKVYADPDPGIESYEYDPAGNLKAYTDALHETANVTYTYDALNRLSSVNQLAEQTPERWTDTVYSYDSHGNLISVTDANGNLTEYGVDDFGQTYLIDSPVTGVSKMTYDKAGRLVGREDARSAVETREYGLSGGPVEITSTLSGMADEVVTFEYDHGMKTGATSGSIIENWSYDRRGAVLEYQRDDQTLLNEYTLDGHLSKRKRLPCEIVNLNPDWAGRPSSVTYSPPDCSKTYNLIAMEIDWLPFGPMERIQRNESVEEQMSYDRQYRMTSQTVTNGKGLSVVGRNYGYDNAGNLLSVANTVDPEKNRVFEYDDLSRLTHAEGSFGSHGVIDYQYDDIGSRTQRTMTPAPGDQMEKFFMVGSTPMVDYVEHHVNGSFVSYGVMRDDVGNVTQDEWSEYIYSPRNKLVDRRPIGGYFFSAWYYSFDAAGLRASTVHPGAEDSLATQHYHSNGEQFYEADFFRGIEESATSFIYVGGRLLARAVHKFEKGSPVGSEIQHVVSDHIGFPIASLNPDGGVLWQAENRPFGEIAEATGNADPMLRYPGQWATQDDTQGMSELFYNGYRWYRPGWGRYSQSDPIGIRGGPNTFSYAHQNPFRFVDPLGLKCNSWSPPRSWRDVYTYTENSPWVDWTDFVTGPIPLGRWGRVWNVDRTVPDAGRTGSGFGIRCCRTNYRNMAIEYGQKITRTCDCSWNSDGPLPDGFRFFDFIEVPGDDGCCDRIVEVAVKRGTWDVVPLSDEAECRWHWGKCSDLN